MIDYVADPAATDALEREIVALGDQAIGVDADVSRVDELQTLVDAAVAKFGRVDVMVNNAGVETRTSVLDTTEAQYDRVLSINLKSAFFGTQIAAKQMIKQGGGGRIINITSVHEDWPMPGNTAYCLAKGGMRMLTRTAGVELAPHGICVVGVGPGAVATPINLSTMKDPALLAKLNAAIPLGRMAQPEEIANVVVFLAGDGGELSDRDDDFRRRRDDAEQRRAVAAMAERYDVIIIGSGAGGGTLAHRLAPSGKKILILERGDWLPREARNWNVDDVFRRQPLRLPGDVAVCRTASRSSRRFTISSAARPRCSARRSIACARRISARCGITTAFRPPGRSPTTNSSPTTPRPSSSIRCTANTASIPPNRRRARPIRRRRSRTNRASRNCPTISPPPATTRSPRPPR